MNINLSKLNPKRFFESYGDIYGLHDDKKNGRLMSLTSTMISTVYNIFITGIFYTGFLTMYDISITDVGIISFIPYIASCFSIFSSRVLAPFKKRKWVLLGAKVFFYLMYIIATTVMPELVHDHQARIYCFIGIIFLAYAVNSLFSPGFTTWFLNFFPEDNEQKTRYFMSRQLFSAVLNSIVLLVSSLITDAVSGSAHQNEIIITMRYIAFVLVLVDVYFQSRAAEYPYPLSDNPRFSQIFTLSFHYKKLMLCMALCFAWNYVGNLNNGLWNYHLLNHVKLSYITINMSSVIYMLMYIFFGRFWRSVLRRYSWIKTFGIVNMVWFPTEVAFFLFSQRTLYLYYPTLMLQCFLNVGVNLTLQNIIFLNMPREDNTTHVALYTIGCNIFAFLGLMTGTAVSSVTGDTTMPFMGMDIYSVQFTTLMRAIIMFAMGAICFWQWKAFSPEEDIAEVANQAEVHRLMRAQRRIRRKLPR